MMTEFNSVCTVGVGTIGASWAAFYAARGMQVTLYEPAAEARAAGLARAQAHLDFLRAHDLLDDDGHAAAQARLRSAQTLADAVAGADVVHESAYEDLAVKRTLYAELEALLAPTTVVLSSTSFLRVTELAAEMQHPERMLLAHPFNPPHLVPLVELVGGERTDASVIARVRTWYEALGKVPVVLNREVYGHIANRLAAALWREAIDLVATGVASVEDVDKALTAGPGIRYALMGPELTYHLGGGEGGLRYFIDHLGGPFARCWEELASWDTMPDGVDQQLVDGIEAATAGQDLTALAAWRDEKLAALVRTLY
jgi:3-hydroxyacyl-CoA dehydrogenase